MGIARREARSSGFVARGSREPEKGGDGLGAGKVMVEAGADANVRSDGLLSIGELSGRIGWRASMIRGSRRRESTPVNTVPDESAVLSVERPSGRGFWSVTGKAVAPPYVVATAGAKDPGETSGTVAVHLFDERRASGTFASLCSDMKDAPISKSVPEATP
eukprot:scaffold17651_cov118-Isochrysis_galbana.AAC.3